MPELMWTLADERKYQGIKGRALAGGASEEEADRVAAQAFRHRWEPVDAAARAKESAPASEAPPKKAKTVRKSPPKKVSAPPEEPRAEE